MHGCRNRFTCPHYSACAHTHTHAHTHQCVAPCQAEVTCRRVTLFCPSGRAFLMRPSCSHVHLCLPLRRGKKKKHEPEHLRDCIQVPGSAGALTLNVECTTQTGMFIHGGLSALHKEEEEDEGDNRPVFTLFCFALLFSLCVLDVLLGGIIAAAFCC